jgi:transketolase
LPDTVKARVSVEAGLALGWSKYVPHGDSVSIEHYGASADYKTLFSKFGITTEAVVNMAKKVLGR